LKLIDILGGTPLPVGYRMAFLTVFFREPLLRRIEREHGLVRPEWTVLVCLAYQDGLNARDICEITEQPSNSISRGVASLLDKGFVARRPDPEDARRNMLDITPAGREVYSAAMDLFVQAETHMTACLSDAERATLIGLLDKLARDVPRWRTMPPYTEANDD
jgi:DNA-binding MarR family transcriptional regulator